jgi:dolichyl-phosphate beta-glucosyltransferase
VSEATLQLSIVIPAYNEEVRLRRHVPSVIEFIKERGMSFEVIIVNDGSRDGTERVAAELARQHPEIRLLSLNPNQGKGAAVRVGMIASQGDVVLFTDADQSTPIEEMDKLASKLRNDGFDIAIGSRGVEGAKVEQAQVWYRHLAGDLFGWATHLLCLRGIVDTQCGFKAMRRDVAHRVFPQVTSNTPIFDIEMLLVATREGYRIAEVPVRWVHDPDTRIPYNFRRALGIWAELFRIRKAHHIGWPVKAKTTP